jgi:anti-sigma factor RsiW
MTVVCSTVRVALDTVGIAAITGPVASHVESCATCTHEVAAFETLSAELRTLPPDVYSAPSEFEDKVMNSLGPIAVPDIELRQSKVVPLAAAVATVAMATAAAGTAVLIHLRRSRAA